MAMSSRLMATLLTLAVHAMAAPDVALMPQDELLGEAGDEPAVDRIKASLKDYDPRSKLNWLSFEALKDPQAHHEELPTWYKHMHKMMVSTSASNRREAQDATFILRQPLCVPGEGDCPQEPEGMLGCFSLESANYQGYFISKEPGKSKLHLEQKSTDGRTADQTLCMTQGLAGAHMLSLQVLSSPGLFVSVRESILRLCDNKGADDACGALDQDDFDRRATAYAYQGIFNGRCSGPDAPKKCECLPGWLGRKCDQECPGGYDEVLGTCNGVGKCSLESTTGSAGCVCNEGWMGLSCTEKCPEHSGLVCSGQSAGTCWMSPQDGVGCRCKDHRKGKLCELTCPGVSDPGTPPCNGHGTCELNETGDDTICHCDKGFLGSECELPCPTGDKGLVCSGFGRCEISKLGIATCVCGETRRGKSCELKCPRDPAGFVCSRNGACVVAAGQAACACEDGFLGIKCEHKCPGVIEGRVCSGHGGCEIKANKHGVDQAKCVCESTHGGDDCLLPCEVDAEGNPCNGHGKCAGDGKCDCDNGFIGNSCQVACPMKDAMVCAAHGKCIPPAEAEPDAPEEEEGAEQPAATCDCDRGFLGPNCALSCPATDEGVICGGRGRCVMSGGHSSCACQSGSRGEACQFVCPGSLSSDKVCSGHGECHAHPADKPIAAICTECDDGFVGADCSLKCPNLSAKGLPCGGEGKCLETNGVATCSCNDGFLGDGCEFDCPRDRKGRSCAGEGRCSILGNKAVCKCNEGFLGHNCDLVCPRNMDSKETCSGHGSCVRALDGGSAECECDAGFTGSSCNSGCPQGKNGLACAGHGRCEIQGTQGGCACDDGFSGADCSQYTCSTPNAVYNKVTAQCVCPVGAICCPRAALEDKQSKEEKIRDLEVQTRELHRRIAEEQQRTN